MYKTAEAKHMCSPTEIHAYTQHMRKYLISGKQWGLRTCMCLESAERSSLSLVSWQNSWGRHSDVIFLNAIKKSILRMLASLLYKTWWPVCCFILFSLLLSDQGTNRLSHNLLEQQNLTQECFVIVSLLWRSWLSYCLMVSLDMIYF